MNKQNTVEGLAFIFACFLILISLVSVMALLNMPKPTPLPMPAPTNEELQCAHVLRGSLMRSNLEPPSIEKLIGVCRGVINNAE